MLKGMVGATYPLGGDGWRNVPLDIPGAALDIDHASHLDRRGHHDAHRDHQADRETSQRQPASPPAPGTRRWARDPTLLTDADAPGMPGEYPIGSVACRDYG